MAKSSDSSQHEHIRILPEQWRRVERAAEGTTHAANQLLVASRWRFSTIASHSVLKVASASLFTAQAIARKLIAEGRENEVQEIREFISTIVSDPDAK